MVPESEHGRWTLFEDLATHFRDKPVRCAVHAGPHSRALEAQPETAIAEGARRALRSMYGDALTSLSVIACSGWSDDGHARGAFSYLGSHATLDDRDALASPVGSALFFAGEATSRGYAASVRGAYESGERAVRELLTAQRARRIP